MIVDLLRNDLISRLVPGSVNVPELFTIESYNDADDLDRYRAPVRRAECGGCRKGTISCGSITGAPKSGQWRSSTKQTSAPGPYTGS